MGSDTFLPKRTCGSLSMDSPLSATCLVSAFTHKEGSVLAQEYVTQELPQLIEKLGLKNTTLDALHC